MNDYYDFISKDFNDKTKAIEYEDVNSLDFYPRAYNVTDEMFKQEIAFPQDIQDTMGLYDLNNIMNNNMKENCGMYDVEEGFIRGNMFPTLFDPYKKLQLKMPSVENEKESLMLEIQKIGFAAKDINLYLDVHPNDNCMIQKFSKYIERLNTLTNEYEQKFGPITLSTPNQSLNDVPWAWNETLSPWERRNK